MIYFDNAATSGKKPIEVIKAVNNAIINYSANPGRSGHTLSQRVAEKVYLVREKIAAFFGASGPENVILTSNCTHSSNLVIKGVLNKPDHIIISSLEHNSVIRPIVKLGIEYDIAKVDFENDDQTVKNFEKLIKANTKLIFCTAASNVTGKILPISQIGELCKRRGILFGVDAAQLAGIRSIDMKKLNIDFLCVAPHKGLYAPMGTGILIAEKYIENTLIEGGTGSNSGSLIQPSESPERYESGTVNVAGIFGIGAGIDFVKNKGIEQIYHHEMELIKYAYRGLMKIKNICLYTPYPIEPFYAPVLSFNFKGVHSEIAALNLSKNGIAVRGGLHCSPLAHKELGTLDFGAVRLSVSYFNSMREIEYFLEVIKSQKFIKNLKINVDTKDLI